MKERPILMSGPMVRALLDGRKTQTRRVVKPQPTGEPRRLSEWSCSLATACHDHSPTTEKLASHSERMKGRVFPFTTDNGSLVSPVCPYGQPGDRLWVRETWAHEPARHGPNQQRVVFQADMTSVPFTTDYDAKCLLAGVCLNPPRSIKWRPSIHMPYRAARLFLEITDVRVERVNQISDAGARAEGVPCAYPIAQVEFRELWESIHGPGAWDRNDWVWVIAFKRVAP